MADNIWNLGNVPGNRPDDAIAQDVIIEIDNGGPSAMTDEGIVTELPDGSVAVDLSPKVDEGENKHYDNLAMRMDQSELGRIGEQLIDAIEADDQSRAEWLQTRARGLELLGLKLEEPKGDVGSTSAPVEGIDRKSTRLNSSHRT